MESHEVLREAIEAVGAKAVAHELKLSTSLVYKWCEDDDSASGARNPLDRVAAVVRATGSVEPVAWLCRGAGGCFVPDADVDEALETEVLTHTQQMLSKFSSLLEVVTASLNDDGVVDAAEAARIRDAWQQLKRYGESFVRACEQGRFDG